MEDIFTETTVFTTLVVVFLYPLSLVKQCYGIYPHSLFCSHFQFKLLLLISVDPTVVVPIWEFVCILHCLPPVSTA